MLRRCPTRDSRRCRLKSIVCGRKTERSVSFWTLRHCRSAPSRRCRKKRAPAERSGFSSCQTGRKPLNRRTWLSSDRERFQGSTRHPQGAPTGLRMESRTRSLSDPRRRRLLRARSGCSAHLGWRWSAAMVFRVDADCEQPCLPLATTISFGSSTSLPRPKPLMLPAPAITQGGRGHQDGRVGAGAGQPRLGGFRSRWNALAQGAFQSAA